MSSGLSLSVDALVAALQQVASLVGFDHPPDGINDFPAAFVSIQNIDPEVVMAGNTFTGTFDIVLLVASAESADGYDLLYDHIDPTHATSLLKQIRDDPTLGGAVDWARVTGISNIGRRETPGGGWYFTATFAVQICKSVA